MTAGVVGTIIIHNVVKSVIEPFIISSIIVNLPPTTRGKAVHNEYFPFTYTSHDSWGPGRMLPTRGGEEGGEKRHGVVFTDGGKHNMCTQLFNVFGTMCRVYVTIMIYYLYKYLCNEKIKTKFNVYSRAAGLYEFLQLNLFLSISETVINLCANCKRYRKILEN